MTKIITSIPLKKNDEAVTADSQNQKNIQTTEGGGVLDEEMEKEGTHYIDTPLIMQQINDNTSKEKYAASSCSNNNGTLPHDKDNHVNSSEKK